MAMSAMLSFMLLATGASLRSNQHELLDLMPKPEPDYSSINYGNFTGREGREAKKINFDDIKALIDYLTREDEFRRGLRTTGVDVMRLVSIYQEVPKPNDLKPWIDWFHSEDGGGEKYKQDAIKAALEVLFDGNHSSLEDIKKWSDLFYSYFEDKVGSSRKRKLSYRKKATQRALEVLATEDHPDMETLDAWTKALASKDMLFGDKDEASQYALAALTTKRRRSMMTVKTILWHAIPVVCEGRLLLVGGTGLDAHPVREVWAADMQRWYPVNWQSTSTNAPWEDAICALWVCNSQNNHYGGSLLLFDATSTLWSSKDDGCTWSKLAKLPFGQGSEQLAFVRHCCGVLVAVTISTRVWMSQDGVTWSAADVARGDPMGPYSNGNSLPMSDRPPGLRCQVTDVVSLDSSEMLVVARHRETCKLTLWRLALQEGRACWQCLVPDIHIYPGFSSVNQLVAAGRAAVKTPEGEEMRAVYVEFNPINEFTVWRASPLAVDRHRQMLDRLGTGQTKVDIFTWQKHIMGALLPQMGNDWVPRGLSIQAIQTSELPYQEEDEFTYWH